MFTRRETFFLQPLPTPSFFPILSPPAFVPVSNFWLILQTFSVSAHLSYSRPSLGLLSHPSFLIYSASRSQLPFPHWVLELGCLLRFPSLSGCQLEDALKAQERQFHLLTPATRKAPEGEITAGYALLSCFAVKYSAQSRFNQQIGTAL